MPYAMMLLSEGYPSLDKSGKCVFIWWLSTAPDSALKANGYTLPKPTLGLEMLLDIAIQRSFALGYDGKVALHADKSGKEALFCMYRDRARFWHVPFPHLTLARYAATGNDGRYFQVTGNHSRALIATMDYLR